MSTKNQHQNAHLILFAVAVASVLLPFVDLPPLLLTSMLLLFFATIIIFLDNFKGLLLFCLIRPVLDYFTNETIFVIGPISINIAALLGAAVITIATILAVSNWDKLRLTPMIPQWIFFFAFVVLSLPLSIDKTESISEIVRLLTIFSMFLIGYFSIRSTSKLNIFVNVLIASMVIPAFFAFWQYFHVLGLSLSFEDIPNRVFGTFAHPNLLAFYIAFVLGLLLFKLLRQKKHDPKLLWLFLIALLLPLLAQTYTRGAWIVFVLIILVLGSFQYRKMLTISIGLFLTAYLLLSPIQERINSSFSSGQSSSVQWRFVIWSDGIDYAMEKPLTGHGAGTTESVIGARRLQVFESHALHNDFIKIALEYGFGGFIAFVVLLGSLLTKNIEVFKKINKKSTSSTLVLAFIAISSSLFFASFFDNIIDTTALQWALWALAGGILGTFYKKRK